MSYKVFSKGQKLVTAGLDMAGITTMEEVEFVRYLDEPNTYVNDKNGHVTILDCVVKDGNINIQTSSADLTSTDYSISLAGEAILDTLNY